mgnify:CR=1 FL=1
MGQALMDPQGPHRPEVPPQAFTRVRWILARKLRAVHCPTKQKKQKLTIYIYTVIEWL